MWGRDSGAMAIATQALAKGTEAATGVAVLSAQVGSHLAECSRTNAERAASERENHRLTEEWRKGLGDRLDRQDRQLMRAVVTGLIALATVLLSITGFLLEHYVLK